MFTRETIKQLKQVNISADAEKTKARIAGLWKNAPKKKRAEVLELAGVALATVQRAYKTGSVSAKLAIPLAQTLDVNPFFITGESDSAGECSDILLIELLEKLGYHKLLGVYEAAERSRVRRERRESKKQVVEAAEIEIAVEPEDEPEVPESESCRGASAPEAKEDAACCAKSGGFNALADSLTEEDMALLLKSVLLRAKAGGKHAETADKIKRLLLS
jgi:hypothetical protein